MRMTISCLLNTQEVPSQGGTECPSGTTPTSPFFYGGTQALQIRFPAPQHLSRFCSGGLFFSRCGVSVSVCSLLSGPDGLCRFGNQRETSLVGDRERKEEERRAELSPMLQLGILSSFLMEGLMDISSFLLFPSLYFSHWMTLVPLMTQFITLTLLVHL